MCLKMLEKSRVTPCVTGYYYTRQPHMLIENIEDFPRDTCHANLPGEMACPKPKRLQILDLSHVTPCVTPTSYLVTRPRYVRVTPAPFLIEGGCHAAPVTEEISSFGWPSFLRRQILATADGITPAARANGAGLGLRPARVRAETTR